MAEVLLISNAKPDQQSLDFDSLREQGITNIQNLASKVWTDYNAHDPGVTILEQLIYAITELGYKTNFDIKDILAQNPDDPKQLNTGLFTAPEILSNTPVHIDDFRKLLIDVEGVRNAFLKLANRTEIPVFIDHKQNIAAYSGDEPVNIRGLYSVILELDRNDEFGDLNSNIMDWSFTTIQGSQPILLDVEVSFPDWMTAAHVMKSTIYRHDDLLHLPRIVYIEMVSHSFVTVDRRTYAATLEVHVAEVDSDPTPKVVFLPITIIILDDISKYDSNKLESDLQHSFHLVTTGGDPYIELASTVEALILNYNRKMITTWEIADTAQGRLNSYRNLCEDFIEMRNMQVEEVGLCLQIEVGPGADVEMIEAEIYFRVSNFLSPRIPFHTATELLDRGMTIDQIFEGPVLDHGFLDLKEALTIDERKVLYVSDLIQIIMDIPGVISVADIHLSSYIDNILMNDEVDDCLAPTLEETHRLRLSVDKSSTIFFRDDDPTDLEKVFLIASRKRVKEKLRELEILENDLLLGNDPNEFDAPQGTYRPLGEYYSIQNGFPVNYGIGAAGLAANATPLRNAQAKQLKSFLLFSEQLLANLLGQLTHIKELFSIDPALKQTYFAQLIDIPNPFPESNPYNPYTDPTKFQYYLQDIIEGKELYIDRRNRVLDHLLARFAEDFTNYSLKLYEVFGSGIEQRLIKDKLNFLNNLPVVSGERLRSYNYKAFGNTWNTDNVPGYQKRVSLKLGIENFKRKSLSFAYDERIDDVNRAFRLYEELDGNAPAPAGAATNGGAGGIVWTNLSGIAQEGESDTPNEVHTGLLNEGQISDYLVVTGFDFSFIPSGATIQGVKAEIVKRIDSAVGVNIDGDIQDYEIKLVKGGVVSGSNHANTDDVWPAARIYTSYGGPLDLWDVSLTDTDVKDANFGVAIRVIKSGPRQRQANVDHVKMTVYYSGGVVTYFFETQPEYRSFGISSIPGGYSTEQIRKDIITEVVEYGYNFCNYCKGLGDYSIKKSLTTEDRDDMCTPIELIIDSFDIPTNKVVILNTDLRIPLHAGKKVVLVDNTSTNYNHVVQSVTFVPAATPTPAYSEVFLAETIQDNLTKLEYDKIDSIDVVFSGLSSVGGAQAAADFSDLIFDIFWDFEGMHVIEHLLLRPKVNESLFDTIPSNKIKAPDTGKVSYTIKNALVVLDYGNNKIILPNDMRAAFPIFSTIQLIDKYDNYTPYTVQTVTYLSGTNQTIIQPQETLEQDDEIALLAYTRTFPIGEFNNSNNSILIKNQNLHDEITNYLASDAGLAEGFVFEISNSVYNNAIYQIVDASNVVVESPHTRLIIQKIKKTFADKLLPIVLSEDDCTCPELKDNYSFRVSVIMPEWPTRFTNSNFRKLAERILRYEAPGHVYVRLIWADRAQMKTFEQAYKTWLNQTASTLTDPDDPASVTTYKETLNIAHDALVTELFSLRNRFTGSVISDITDDSGSTGELSLLGQIYLG